MRDDLHPPHGAHRWCQRCLCAALVGVVLALGVARCSRAQAPPAVRSRAAAATPEAIRPGYAQDPGTLWKDAPSWLVLGLEQRVRGEHRSGRLRERPEATELGFGLSRSRLFVGIEPASSAITFAFELSDARQFATDLPKTPVTVNELDLLQAKMTLELTRWLGSPFTIELGRTSFDAIDRRLIARNRFRNTTNAFDGARVRLGNRTATRGLEFLALIPTQRRPQTLDRPYENRRLLGVVGEMRSSSIAFEPYYLYTRADEASRVRLHTLGFHLYGPLTPRLDHDVDFAYQLGTSEGRTHAAFALHAELGHSFARGGSSRLALWVNYASGDRDPDDDRNETFVPLFGASHMMYGFTDLFAWQNLVNPTASYSLRASRSVRVDAFYRCYWLASSRDAWTRAGLQDPRGPAGSFLGQELDIGFRWSFLRAFELELSYGELFAGKFVGRTGGGRGATVFFASISVGTGGW